jgi:HEAT repeat protein
VSSAGETPGARLQQLLADDAPGARRAALELLASVPTAAAGTLVDAAAAGPLVGALASAKRSEQRRAAEILAPLVSGSPALHTALRRALDAPDARLRWGAAYTLGRALPAGPELWPAARAAMALDDGDQRWAAAELTCAIARNHPALLSEIRSALRDERATLRKMSLYCLRDLGTAETTALARDLLGDPDAGVRLAALSALARTAPGSSDAVQSAARLLPLLRGDPDVGVRRAVAATLGKLGVGGDDVLQALRAAAAEADPSLARAARAAAAALAPPG